MLISQSYLVLSPRITPIPPTPPPLSEGQDIEARGRSSGPFCKSHATSGKGEIGDDRVGWIVVPPIERIFFK